MSLLVLPFQLALEHLSGRAGVCVVAVAWLKV